MNQLCGRSWLGSLRKWDWGLGWHSSQLSTTDAGRWSRCHAGKERSGCAERRLSARWPSLLQRQTESIWREAEDTELLVPSHPSRRGRAGKKRKLPLAGCFPLSNKVSQQMTQLYTKEQWNKCLQGAFLNAKSYKPVSGRKQDSRFPGAQFRQYLTTRLWGIGRAPVPLLAVLLTNHKYNFSFSFKEINKYHP